MASAAYCISELLLQRHASTSFTLVESWAIDRPSVVFKERVSLKDIRDNGMRETVEERRKTGDFSRSMKK
jgi:hypothetical protein